jgi:hypothetical protein
LTLAVHDDGFGGGPALYAGGTFTTAFDSGDSYLAKWGCSSCTEDVDGDGWQSASKTDPHRRRIRTHLGFT